MHGRQPGRVAVCLLVALGLLATGGLPASSSATGSSAVTCDTSWKSPANGLWADAANWDNGVPDGSHVACITVAGTYTVTVSGGTAKSLALGGASGTQTLAVDAGAQTDAQLSLQSDSSVLANGVLKLTGESALSPPGGNVLLDINSGALTIMGMLIVDPTGGGGRQLRALYVNQGRVDVNGDVSYLGTTFTNEGSLTTASGKTFSFT